MNPLDHLQDTSSEVSLGKIIAGGAGAFVSLRFVQGKWYEKVIMVVGGTLLSVFAAGPTARYLHMTDAEGLCGFVIGLFGMAVVAKVYETIQAVETQKFLDRLLDWIFPNRGS